MSVRFWLAQSVGLAGLFVFWRLGYVDLVLKSDQTYLSVVIFFMFLVGCGFTWWGDKIVHADATGFDKADWLRRRLVNFGFIGTMLGFIIALSGVDADSANSIEAIRPMVAQLISGMGVALFTTLVGLITAEWLGFIIEWFDIRESE